MNDKLKIGLFSYASPYSTISFNTGIENTIYYFVKYLSSKAEVTIYTSLSKSDMIQRELQLNGIRVLRAGGSKCSLFSFNMFMHALNLFNEYKNEIEKEDVLHDIGSFISVWFNRFKKPSVSTFHHYEAPWGMKGYLTAVPTSFLAKKYLGSTQIVTPSEFSKKQFLQKFNFSDDKVCVIPWGVDSNIYRPAGEAIHRRENTVLYVGTLSRRKGLIYLIRAIPLVKKEIGNIKIIIIGEGPQKEYLFKEALNLGVVNNVEFLKYVNEDKLPQYYRTATVSVLPSLLEGFGQTVLESMASATPVIASNIEPLTDLIGDTGLYFAIGDNVGLAQQIIRLLKNEQLRITLSKKARSRAKEYSWENATQRHIELYQQLVKEDRK